MFSYETITEEEIVEGNLLPKGIYDFRVEKIELKKGKEKESAQYLEVHHITTHNGKDYKIRGSLSAHEKMRFKIRHFANTVDIMELYESKKLEVDQLNKMRLFGKYKLDIEPYQTEDGEFRKKNKVVDYIKRERWSALKSKNETFEDVPL